MHLIRKTKLYAHGPRMRLSQAEGKSRPEPLAVTWLAEYSDMYGSQWATPAQERKSGEYSLIMRILVEAEGRRSLTEELSNTFLKRTKSTHPRWPSMQDVEKFGLSRHGIVTIHRFRRWSRLNDSSFLGLHMSWHKRWFAKYPENPKRGNCLFGYERFSPWGKICSKTQRKSSILYEKV